MHVRAQDTSRSWPANGGEPSPITCGMPDPGFSGAAPRRVRPLISVALPWAPVAGLPPGISRLAAGMAYYSCSQPVNDSRGGPGGTRTLDPHNAIVVRSQLRYGPTLR